MTATAPGLVGAEGSVAAARDGAGAWAAMRRFAALPVVAVRDLGRGGREVPPLSAADAEAAVAAGIRWLCLTHDVTGRRGCSKGYSYLFGWMAPFPETTGYIIGTLLARAAATGDEGLVGRTREMGDWEIDVQNPDGGVVVGLLEGGPKPSTVFNTGMVMHGWLDLHARTGEDRYLEAAVRGGEYLVRTQERDGAWRGAAEYRGVPHTYASRVSWALVRLADTTGDDRYRATARRQLDWVLTMQRENGWFDACAFAPSLEPNTHVLAYTLRGLVESSVLLEDDSYLDAAVTTADVLLRLYRELGWLPATYDGGWTPRARYECVTGIAQLGGIWLRLYELTGDRRWLDGGLDAVAYAASRQMRSSWRPVDGAVPGSFPIFGRYAPLQYPNWATKFLVDSLMLRESLRSVV